MVKKSCNPKLYRIKLVSKNCDIFGFSLPSKDWDKFAEAMEHDVHKKKQIKFVHPKDSEIKYNRKYLLCPANGNTLLVVGQFREPMDFSYVFVVLHSMDNKEPYIVIERYKKSFSNPRMMIEMLECAFNYVLSDLGVEVKLVAWDNQEVMKKYRDDFWDSYNLELEKSNGRQLIRMGYEDALETYEKQQESMLVKTLKKSDNIWAYIRHKNKEAIINFLRQSLCGMRTPKEIARPVRLLCDRKIFKDNDIYRLPYKAFIKEIPEAKAFISEKKYNHWLNPNATNYDDDDVYKELSLKLDLIL